jgi:hypothetical protein
MPGDVIEDYVTELAAALTVPPRVRRRALLEARDHLLSAAEHKRAAGLDPAAAQAAAVREHGPAALIARRYAEQLAHGAAQLATVAGLAAVIAYAALCAVATQISPAHASGVADAISWFAVQVALTCAGLSTIRALRHRADSALPAGKLRFINRGWAVAIGAVLVSVSATLLGGYGDGAAGSAWRTGLLVATATTALAAVLALASVLLSARRTAELAAHADDPAGDDALDDLGALALIAAGRLLPAGTLERAQASLARLETARAVRAVALRAHPWRFCVLVALAAGAAMAATHVLAEGPATDGLLVTLAVSAVLVAIEAVAIIACFALLGSFLGIRRGQRFISAW